MRTRLGRPQGSPHPRRPSPARRAAELSEPLQVAVLLGSSPQPPLTSRPPWHAKCIMMIMARRQGSGAQDAPRRADARAACAEPDSCRLPVLGIECVASGRVSRLADHAFQALRNMASLAETCSRNMGCRSIDGEYLLAGTSRPSASAIA